MLVIIMAVCRRMGGWTKQASRQQQGLLSPTRVGLEVHAHTDPAQCVRLLEHERHHVIGADALRTTGQGTEEEDGWCSQTATTAH